MSLRFVLYLLSLWFLVRFLTGYLLPLFRQGMRMPDQSSGASDDRSQSYRDRSEAVASAGRPAQGKEGGDYIDFEEVK